MDPLNPHLLRNTAVSLFWMCSKFGLVCFAMHCGHSGPTARSGENQELLVQNSHCDADMFELSEVFPHRNTQDCAETRMSVQINQVQNNELLLYIFIHVAHVVSTVL